MTRFIIKVITLSLLTFTLATGGYSQFPAQSFYDETYAPNPSSVAGTRTHA